MHNHAPKNYKCPVCIAITGLETEDTWIKQADIFYQDELVTGFISSKSIKGNEGHPLVVPNNHYENIYDLPEKVGHRIIDIGKKISVGLKEVRNCDGVNFVQNNEPAAGQHAFHYHLHIIPRFEGDNYNEEFWKAEKSEPVERLQYAKNLRKYFTC
ncbi:HIT domain-containing protein [Patescibacteria group bacterium]|nr:HIT domain-containing protein [Patescibacteria group bacterium]